MLFITEGMEKSRLTLLNRWWVIGGTLKVLVIDLVSLDFKFWGLKELFFFSRVLGIQEFLNVE